ncbi:MAG: hypothetical protein WC865_16030 [Bacteroidales bacterium]
MKRITLTFILLLMILGTNLFAQKANYTEKHGRTLNLGSGIGGYSGYYGYIGRTLPVLHINYEFDVANNFTLAPFATFYTYRGDNYRETVIPVGVKGTFYFDQLLRANSNWDFYLAGSLGFAIVNSAWDTDYHGDRNYWHNPGPLFLDIHVGAEYHLNNQLGVFLDLSNGVSTIGLAIH